MASPPRPSLCIERWLCLVLLLISGFVTCSTVEERKLNALGGDDMRTLVEVLNATKSVDPTSPTSHLSKILIPRPRELHCESRHKVCQSLRHAWFPAGTENNTFVRNYIATTLKNLEWHVEEDSFTAITPYGEKSFTNVIATFNPDAPRRVIMAAHFDSKYFSTYPANQVSNPPRFSQSLKVRTRA